MPQEPRSCIQDLSGDHWHFTFADRASVCATTMADFAAAGLTFRPCRVPGNFELDLQACGLIPEPFHGLNMLALARYERTHVWYATTFRADPPPSGQTADLLFEGVDCCADIYLNGRLLGACDNMLVEHAFPVDGHLQPENELLVHIRPALLEAQRYDYPPIVAASGLNWESLYVRKAPHMYGWDIMPRALSAGLWRPVSLRYRPAERIETVYLETVKLADDHSRAHLLLNYTSRLDLTQADTRYELRIEGCCGASSFAASKALTFSAGRVRLDVAAPRLWWPRGYGDAALYEVAVTLLCNGQEIDRRTFAHGIRTVALSRTSTTTPDGQGEFVFLVNGIRIFCKGSNWVPLDAYHSRDLSRVERALEMVADLECNILRCWGGNVYESDRFFDLCDRYGVMVWQDFAMACAVYPQDADFQRRLREEAVKVIRRLRQHPSLLLWAGDNENDLAWPWWHHRGDPNRNVLTRQVLPDALKQEDPQRPYLPSSPHVDAAAFQAALSAESPTGVLPEDHLWGPRNYYKSAFYRRAVCHFVSEIGYHACPNPDSLRRFLSPERVWPWRDNPEWNLHSTNPAGGTEILPAPDYRVKLMVQQIQALFGDVPENLDDFAFASQAVQAEAKKYFIEHFRSTKWRRTGIIWWNLLDGWPQLSDAIVDYYFGRKQAYRHIQAAQRHVALMVREEADDAGTLVAANDTRHDAIFDYTVRDVDSGATLLSGRATAVSNASTALGALPALDGQRFLRIAWTGDGVAGVNHYLAGIPPFRLADYRRWLAAMPELRV